MFLFYKNKTQKTKGPQKMYKFNVIEEETLKIINTLKTKPQVQRDVINRLEELRRKIVISFRDVTYSNCNKYMFQDSDEFILIARDNCQFFKKKNLKSFPQQSTNCQKSFGVLITITIQKLTQNI